MSYSKPDETLLNNIIEPSNRLKEDLTNKVFGRLTVLGYLGNCYWVCKCTCGNIIKVTSTSLRNGTSSCGCYNKEVNRNRCFKYGKTHLYKLWQYMKTRCYNKNRPQYKYYGGRGVIVCNEWKNNYLAFAEWANKHGYKEGLSLDRIDCNGNYTPENCRWVTLDEQKKNRGCNVKITYKGRTENLADWARILNRDAETLRYHVTKYGDLTRFIEEVLPRTGEFYEYNNG